MFDYLIVGAGFAGSVLAERLAAGSNKRVLLCDKRPHIGGNAYDHYNEAGILVHKYGPHIFHTNSREVFEYLSRFTEWRPYEHRVRASVDGQIVPIPINLDTINSLYGLSLTSFEVEEFFKKVAEPVEQIRTSEDVVVSKVGRELYEKFFQNYTRKQWGLDPSELDASVTSRVPTRTNRDDRYFTDTYQAMPLHGYTRMFENMLDHPNIKIMLNCDYREIEKDIPFAEMIYTGPVDSYFDYCYGKLPYRSLEFKHETHHVPVYQSAPVVNYPSADDHGGDAVQVRGLIGVGIGVGDPAQRLPGGQAVQRTSHDVDRQDGAPHLDARQPRRLRRVADGVDVASPGGLGQHEREHREHRDQQERPPGDEGARYPRSLPPKTQQVRGDRIALRLRIQPAGGIDHRQHAESDDERR